MRAEEELQFMMDFYPELFPTRKHCLNHLFCAIGNGYDWKDGELVDGDCEFAKRYRLAEEIVRAKPRDEESYQLRLELEKEIQKEKGDSYRITPQNVKYHFRWSIPSKKYSCLYCYPRNIREDWFSLLKECERYLVEDGIIPDGNRTDRRQEGTVEETGHISGLCF